VLSTGGGVGTYGDGFTALAVVPLPGGLGRQLVRRVEPDGDGPTARVATPLVNGVIGLAPDDRAYLLVGTVPDSVLRPSCPRCWRTARSTRPPRSPSLLPLFLPVAVAVVAGHAVAGEAQAGTLRCLRVRPVGRTKLLVAELISDVVYTMLAVVVVAAEAYVVGVQLFGSGRCRAPPAPSCPRARRRSARCSRCSTSGGRCSAWLPSRCS
jgi:hypothetical protein